MEFSAHIDTFARDNLPPADTWPELRFDLAGLDYPARLNCAGDLVDGAVAVGMGARPAIWSMVDGKPRAMSYWNSRGRPTASPACWSKTWAWCPAIACCCAARTTRCMALAWLAAVKAGLVVVATMPLLRARELAHHRQGRRSMPRCATCG